MLRRSILVFFLAVWMSFSTYSARAGNVINIDEVVSGTLEAVEACLRWEATGICIWMTCAAFVCTFSESLQVQNYVPEATVQVFTKGDEEPWTETREIKLAIQTDNDASWLKVIASAVAGMDLSALSFHGGEATQSNTGKHSATLVHTVDVFGNPANSAWQALAVADYICNNEVIIMFPYFNSNVDLIAWRWSIPEAIYPQSRFGFVVYDLGTPANNYGPFYPRTGNIAQNDPFKSSVLAAFRAMHVVTRIGEPHIYTPLTARSDPGYWPPGSLSKGGGATGQWQMLYPKLEKECSSFPYGSIPPPSLRTDKNEYVWNFWRQFKCCKRKGTTLVDVISINGE